MLVVSVELADCSELEFAADCEESSMLDVLFDGLVSVESDASEGAQPVNTTANINADKNGDSLFFICVTSVDRRRII